MRLGLLFDDSSRGGFDVDVTNVEMDSRLCQPGTLFFAMAGLTTNGERFVDDAVARGAVAVVAAHDVETSVPLIRVPEAALVDELARCCAAVTGHPERRAQLVGVTGTNGKTSVVTLVSALAAALGWSAASIGTLTNVRTTPFAPELYRTLAAVTAEFPERDRCVVAMEVSSHAIDQRRIEGLPFVVGAFTNLSHDHLDYHGSMEQYYQAKAALFTPTRVARAVIWVDDPYGERLAAETSVPVTPVSRRDAAAVRCTRTGSRFEWRGQVVRTRLLGEYNVDNVLVAMTVLSVLGESDDAIAHAMANVPPVPGRFELVSDGDVTVIVDYAHTPDGLERLLRDVRELAPTGRIFCVFGCGGNRDRAKRPLMGAVAERGSDVVIVTSDNPRSEPADAIMEEVIAGVVDGRKVQREVDRRLAIASAIAQARSGDVVVIAGKGHEVTQTIGTDVLPFDDRAVARELMKR